FLATPARRAVHPRCRSGATVAPPHTGGHHMPRRSLTLAGLIVTLLMPGFAAAKDMCLATTMDGATLAILKGCSVHGAGQCQTEAGYLPAAPGTVGGTACTSSDGARLYLSLTRTSIGSIVVLDEVSVNLPALTGTTREAHLVVAGSFAPSVDVSLAKCNPTPT